ncbi:MAG: phosphate acetyltransferase [Omnitrophica bacterium]|nr:phosphate acetyltransferase [Candidatus Omnitrophota bacterium]
MSIFEQIYKKAKTNPKRIVLPEGGDLRVIKAASEAVREKLARIILLGKADLILSKAKRNRLNIKKCEIIEPLRDKKLDEYIGRYRDLRKHRGVTLDQSRKLVSGDPVFFAAMMLRAGRVDSFVAGASHTTSDIARAALRCIKRDPVYSIASGAFLVELKDKRYGENGLFLFADCAIVPLPKPEQLADIAAASSEVWTKVTGYKPRLAMLSFSSKGSGCGPCVDKIREACEILKKLKPDLVIDGELQADSAVVPAVARIKVPNSPIKGRANILIFPNLDSGNIAYKLIQRLAQARVVGPVIQGLSKPCSDLSRGCSPKEIIDAIALTSVMAR